MTVSYMPGDRVKFGSQDPYNTKGRRLMVLTSDERGIIMTDGKMFYGIEQSDSRLLAPAKPSVFVRLFRGLI